jgi:hypothetical protein
VKAKKLNLDYVELFDNSNRECPGIPLKGGVWLDGDNNVYMSRDKSKPKRCTLREALEFLGERWEDLGESLLDSSPSYERFFKLLADKLPRELADRKVDELEKVDGFCEGRKQVALLADKDGNPYVTTNGKVAKPVTLKEAVAWVSKHHRASDGGDTNIDLWCDFLDRVAGALPGKM